MKDLTLITLLIYPIYVTITNGPDVPFFVVIITLVLYLVYFSQIKDRIAGKHRDKDFVFETKRLMNFLIHDFKVPIIAQLRGVELLKNETLGTLNEEQKCIVEEIIHSCNYVLDMISMSDNIYKMDNHKYKPIYEKFSLSEAIISSFDKFSKEIEEKNLNLSYAKTGEDAVIDADKTDIIKVITNLLLNAINCSCSGGKINVKTFADKNKVMMTISGMELEVDSEYSTIGYDIGMYLSKKIIESHNGKIYFPENKNSLNYYAFVLPKNAGDKCDKLCSLLIQ